MVTAAMQQQLEARAQAYPVNWTATDMRASWLAPARLLLNIFIADPRDSMAVQLWIDGQSVPLTKAYNSRGLQHPGTFLGFYFDASQTMVGPQHTYSLLLPAMGPGQFRGLFWHNILPAGLPEHAPVAWCRTPTL